MEGHGTRMMPTVFGGMVNMMTGILVRPLTKEAQFHLLLWIMMEDVFQKFPIKNGNYGMVLILMMLATMSKSDVASNQKV